MGSLVQSIGAGSKFTSTDPYSNTSQFNTEIANQNQIYGQQQGLAAQLQQQMAGNGPNPAQTQFQQNNAQNIANAQGLISSQRGLNPALAARMGANAAATANQQTAGQAATLQAQQQLGSQQQLGGLYGQMQQGNSQNLGLQNQAFLGAGALNQATQGQTAQAAGNAVGGLFNAGGVLGGAGISSSGKAHGGRIEHMSAGGLVGALAALLSKGGRVEHLFDGGDVGDAAGDVGDAASASDTADAGSDPNSESAPGKTSGPGSDMSSKLGKALSKVGSAKSTPPPLIPVLQAPGNISASGGGSDYFSGAAPHLSAGGLISALAALLHKGGEVHGARTMKYGGQVDGTAKYSGDNTKNDTVPTMLSPGEVVIPRTKSHDPEKAAEFIKSLLKSEKGSKTEYKDVLAARRKRKAA